MTKKIRTYDDLLEEKKRLEAQLVIQKQQVKSDWEDMKEEFKPVSNFLAFLGKFTHRDKSNPLLNIGIDVAGNLLLKKVLLARAGWFTRLTVPFLLKNYSSNILSQKGYGLFGKIRQLFKKKKVKTPHNGYDTYNPPNP